MVRLVKPKDLNKMEKQIAMVSQWQTALKTVETINKIPISGEEECLRMSEPLHLTGGGEDSHGGQGEHRTEAWSTPVQVNCLLTISDYMQSTTQSIPFPQVEEEKSRGYYHGANLCWR